MQGSDGGKDGKFDGSPPDAYTPPSWRGVLLILLVTGILLTLGLIAFLSVFARPDGPVFPLPSISQ
jgi:hypothetical protein